MTIVVIGGIYLLIAASMYVPPLRRYLLSIPTWILTISAILLAAADVLTTWAAVIYSGTATELMPGARYLFEVLGFWTAALVIKAPVILLFCWLFALCKRVALHSPSPARQYVAERIGAGLAGFLLIAHGITVLSNTLQLL